MQRGGSDIDVMPRLDPQGVFTVVLLVGTAMTGALGTTTPISAIGARSTGAAAPASKWLGPDGIQMLYPTVNDDMSWYSAASWSTNRSIVQTGGATVDPFDSRSVLHGPGSARIANGLMTITGSPTLSVANDKYGWGNVELTVYARNPSGLNGTAFTGFMIQARSGGASSADQCSFRCYLAKTYFASRQFGMQKQYLATHYSASARTETSSVPYSAFVSRFVGMKLIVRSASNSSTVAVALYVDYSEGVKGGTWQNVLARIDANDWPTINPYTPATYPCNYSDQGAYQGYTANILTPGKTCMITLTSPENSAQQSEWKWFSIRNIGDARPSSTTGRALRTVPTQSAKGSLTRRTSTRRRPSLISVRRTSAAAGAGDVTITSTAPATPLALPIGKAFKAYQFTVAARLGTATYSWTETNVDLPRDLANAMASTAGISAARFTGVHLNANADQSTITFYLLPTASPGNLTELASVAVALVHAFATPTSSLYADLLLDRLTSTIDPNVRARVVLVDLRQCSPGVFGPATADPQTCLQPATGASRPPGSGGTSGGTSSPSLLAPWTFTATLLTALVGVLLVLLLAVAYASRRQGSAPGSSPAPPWSFRTSPATMLPVQPLAASPPAYHSAAYTPGRYSAYAQPGDVLAPYAMPQQQQPAAPFPTFAISNLVSPGDASTAFDDQRRRPDHGWQTAMAVAGADSDAQGGGRHDRHGIVVVVVHDGRQRHAGTRACPRPAGAQSTWDGGRHADVR